VRSEGEGEGGAAGESTVLDRLNEVAAAYQPFWAMAAAAAGLASVAVALLAVAISVVAFALD
jgi:hypothetical protein